VTAVLFCGNSRLDRRASFTSFLKGTTHKRMQDLGIDKATLDAIPKDEVVVMPK
jgi:hypothetical protein